MAPGHYLLTRLGVPLGGGRASNSGAMALIVSDRLSGALYFEYGGSGMIDSNDPFLCV